MRGVDRLLNSCACLIQGKGNLFHLACDKGHIDIVNYFLSKGCDVTAASKVFIISSLTL
jgi:ankyrin repeat protein